MLGLKKIQWDFKRIAGILALVGTLFGGLGSAAGWYSARIQADVQADIERESIENRLDHLESRFDIQVKKLDYQKELQARADGMLTALMISKGLAPPPPLPPPPNEALKE